MNTGLAPACRWRSNGFLWAHRLGRRHLGNLRANVLTMTAGTIGAWWTERLSVFWRAQIVGWGLFCLVDLANRLLTYHSLGVAFALTLLVTPCLVVLSAWMRVIYASHNFSNRLTPRSLGLIGVLSIGASTIIVMLVFVARQLFGWKIPHW